MSAGVGGAVLIVAVVLGRGDAAEVTLGFQTLGTEGGVLHTRTEVFERENPYRRVRNALPERRIEESWMRIIPGSGELMSVRAAHSPGGVLLSRGHMTVTPGDPPNTDNLNEHVPNGPVLDWPRSRSANLVFPPEAGVGVRATMEAQIASGELELLSGPREGTIMLVGQHSPERTDVAPDAVTRAYAGDLDAVEILSELVLTEHYQALSQHYWAVRADGSRVLIASRLFHVSLLPLSAWEEIEELVWGN